ncbi:glutathione S-transferase family protein [Roseibium sp. M-1]
MERVHSPCKVVGHRLCPYVQRVVIVLLERRLPFKRIDIDLDDKPDWLFDVSPCGKVPVIRISTGDWLFDSSVIARYLDTLSGEGLLPSDPLARARQEAWITFADGMLAGVADMIYRDLSAKAFHGSITDLAHCLTTVAARFAPERYFAGSEFGLADAVFATLFRCFPVLDEIADGTLEKDLPVVLADWWAEIRDRPAVADAVPRSYHEELRTFIAARDSYAGRFLASRPAAQRNKRFGQ